MSSQVDSPSRGMFPSEGTSNRLELKGRLLESFRLKPAETSETVVKSRYS